MTHLLDPTAENAPVQRERLERPVAHANLRIGLLDISKRRGDIFLNELERAFQGMGYIVKRYRKPTHTRPAPVALQQRIASEVDVVVEGLAD